MVAVTLLVAGLITRTSWPGGSSYDPVENGAPPRLSATYRRSPSGVCPYAMPVGKFPAGMVWVAFSEPSA